MPRQGLQQLGERLAQAYTSGIAEELEETRRRSADSIAHLADRARVPLDTLDVLNEMNNQIAKMRRESRWMLRLTAAILVLTALLVVEVSFL